MLLLTACALIQPNTDPIEQLEGTGNTASVWMPKSEIDKISAGNLFGDTGIPLIGGRNSGQGSGGGIGVNVYLWRASLDTIAFMPLMSADPFGGVIITDWYSPPETPNERFKMSVYILDRQLRADGIRVALFKQKRTNNTEWESQALESDTVTKLEDTILTRARQLRIAALKTNP